MSFSRSFSPLSSKKQMKIFIFSKLFQKVKSIKKLLNIPKKDFDQQLNIRISLSVISSANSHSNKFTIRIFNVENGSIHIGNFVININILIFDDYFL